MSSILDVVKLKATEKITLKELAFDVKYIGVKEWMRLETYLSMIKDNNEEFQFTTEQIA